MYHVTQAKAKLRDRFWSDLPAKLAEADAAAHDGIVTPVPYEIHTTDKFDIGGLPSLELIVTSSSPRLDAMVQMYRHRLVVGVSVGGDDEETISIQLERYVWSLRAIARDLHLTPVEGTAALDTGEEQYSPVAQRPATVESPFVKSAFLEVFITTLE